MHHRYGLRAGGDQWRNQFSSDRTRIGIHIGEHGLGAQQHRTGGSGDKRAGCGDQLVTSTQTNGEIGHGEGQGAIGHGDGVAAAAPISELLLKSFRFLARPGVYLAGGEHTAGCSDLLRVELGPGSEGKDHQIKILKTNKKDLRAPFDDQENKSDTFSCYNLAPGDQANKQIMQKIKTKN